MIMIDDAAAKAEAAAKAKEAVKGEYAAPKLEKAGAAVQLVQGWAFSGWDCGYATFYNAGSC